MTTARVYIIDLNDIAHAELPFGVDTHHAKATCFTFPYGIHVLLVKGFKLKLRRGFLFL